MNTFDMITYVQYNNWGNERLVAVAEQIPPDQLRTGTLSKGDAFETLRHVVDVEWSWRMACEEKPATQVLWEIEPLEDLPAVKAYWQAEGERLLAFVRGLSEADFEREVIPSWQDKSAKIKHILMHLVNHGTNHRSELGWYFTSLGYSPGDLDFLDYIATLRT